MYLYWSVLISMKTKFFIAEAAKHPETLKPSTTYLTVGNGFFGLSSSLGFLRSVIHPSGPNMLNFYSSTNVKLSKKDVSLSTTDFAKSILNFLVLSLMKKFLLATLLLYR